MKSESKEISTYFGFQGGLGIKFIDETKLKPVKSSKCKQAGFILKSMGNHNSQMKIEDIGSKFYDNKCIEEGNFKTKSTFTYEDALFRPSNKLGSIYNKHHKQEPNFVNEYFEKN